jgi:catechol 2,3-dioxygenase-like lactoylglutathione lyase family enzyme
MDIATNVESNVKQAVPFFWVRDIRDSTRFYSDGLGFNMTKQWIDDGTLRWCWLELGGAAIMLQEFWKEGHHRNLPEAKVGVGVQAQRPFVGNGMWDTQVTDPDGYDLFFESPVALSLCGSPSHLPRINALAILC